MTPTFFNAVQILTNQSAISGKSDGPIEKINFKEGFTDLPTEEAIQAKLTELKNQFPMKVLRQERNQKLAKTDWWCCSDQTPSQAQLDYRQALRDLPASASPSLDENGQLTGVTWPTKPE